MFDILEFTGERMLPEQADDATFWEHIYRYRFALPFAHGRRVLDIACGEGYGSAALHKGGAAAVIGVDISPETCAHARHTYGVDARAGSAEDIPLPAASVDLVVSFETIEHLNNPDQFLRECVRVLAPGGMLILSTPSRETFASAGKSSTFHAHEMTESEFQASLAVHFRDVRFYGQLPQSAAWWSIRSLAAAHTPWDQVRGFHRIRQMLRATHPALWSPLTPSHRQAVELILSRDAMLSALTNPYRVRRRLTRSREEPVYLIAVARTSLS